MTTIPQDTTYLRCPNCEHQESAPFAPGDKCPMCAEPMVEKEQAEAPSNLPPPGTKVRGHNIMGEVTGWVTRMHIDGSTLHREHCGKPCLVVNTISDEDRRDLEARNDYNGKYVWLEGLEILDPPPVAEQAKELCAVCGEKPVDGGKRATRERPFYAVDLIVEGGLKEGDGFCAGCRADSAQENLRRLAARKNPTVEYYGTQPGVLPETLPVGVKFKHGTTLLSEAKYDGRQYYRAGSYLTAAGQHGYQGCWVPEQVDWETVPIQKTTDLPSSSADAAHRETAGPRPSGQGATNSAQPAPGSVDPYAAHRRSRAAYHGVQEDQLDGHIARLMAEYHNAPEAPEKPKPSTHPAAWPSDAYLDAWSCDP